MPATAVDTGRGLFSDIRAMLETAGGILVMAETTGTGDILGTEDITLLFGILTRFATTAVGIATDLGMGSVGSETAILVRGTAAGCCSLAEGWFCSSSTG